MAIGPDHRCVAVGCRKSTELHWVDMKTKQNHRKYLPMSQPSDILHFMTRDCANSRELRLVTSQAGPGILECQCHDPANGNGPHACKLHFLADAHSFGCGAAGNASNIGSVRATQCQHYRAIPASDGIHILFVEPRSGLLCVGSDSPIGRPTSLTRALVCVPPFGQKMADTLQ